MARLCMNASIASTSYGGRYPSFTVVPCPLADEPEAWTGDVLSVQTLADRLGVSDRHLRRIFEAQFGVAPLQYLQTRRRRYRIYI